MSDVAADYAAPEARAERRDMTLDEVLTATRLVTADELAPALGVKRNTLAVWRMNGSGPRYMKLGRVVRYRPEDVRRWLDGATRRSTASEAAAPVEMVS